MSPRTTFSSPICVAVAGHTVEQLFRSAEAALAESGLLELRLDALASPGEATDTLRRFAERHPEATLLATCRRTEGGGSFTGLVEAQLRLLSGFAEAGARLVDVELETLEILSAEVLTAFAQALEAAGCGMIVSAHDFQGASAPEPVLERLQRLGAPARPTIYKVVNTATGLTDNLAMLRFIAASRAAGLPVTGICMGAAGAPSRILAVRSGASFTFGSLGADSGTAAGQLTAQALRDRYRIGAIGEHTRIYGVAGNPVTHSLSPAIHNAAFQAARADAVYLPLHTVSVADLIEFTRALPIAGLSVTMPWKIEILPCLDSVDPLARAIGAVNTVTRQADGSLHGTNTDADAVVGPLAARIPLAGTRVLLAGAGGAARAAAFALTRAGAEVAILNRTGETARALAEATGATVARADSLRNFEVVVNATPIGMVGSGVHAGELPVPLAALADARLVFEMVYRPLETPLVRSARERGIEVIDGLEMFAAQGARQWTTWMGFEPPTGVMRRALEDALVGQD